jgi:hypothetical protein
VPKRSRRRLAAAVAEPWYVAKLVWQLVCANLLPVALGNLQPVLERLVDHIGRADERGRRPRQRDVIQAMLG